ncbi:TPA: hypothetical protein OUD13_003608 [Morganella morganii]|nr:hypothetical protein [Morganella morganii]
MLGSVAYNSDWSIDPGMTLRDYFAAKAMAALIGDGGYGSRNNDLAKGAYSVADAMLRAREK